MVFFHHTTDITDYPRIHEKNSKHHTNINYAT
jgi:hypothetical protein